MARRKLSKRAFNEIDRGMLGGLLFNARKQRRLTQAQLADAIGRDRPWLSDVETGKITHVPDDDLRALSTALDVNPTDLGRARDRTTGRSYANASVVVGAHERHCDACGRANPWDANFCANCGARLPEEVICPDCDRRNPGDANYCSHCGRTIGSPVLT